MNPLRKLLPEVCLPTSSTFLSSLSHVELLNTMKTIILKSFRWVRACGLIWKVFAFMNFPTDATLFMLKLSCGGWIFAGGFIMFSTPWSMFTASCLHSQQSLLDKTCQRLLVNTIPAQTEMRFLPLMLTANRMLSARIELKFSFSRCRKLNLHFLIIRNDSKEGNFSESKAQR